MEESAIEDALDTEFADYEMTWINDDSASTSLPMWVVALALALLLIVLVLPGILAALDRFVVKKSKPKN
ncbi:MAG: hypothetical protein LUE14_11295 [Clostridiales bacterium]|nr:hypothetical protein [Clostridiales bacterium]